MLVGGMVHDKIQADADPPPVALGRQLRKILHSPKLGLYLPEIGNRVAAVVPHPGRIQKRHQMDIVHAAFLDIAKLLFHAL